MNAAQLHLAFNHFPVIASLFGLPLFIWGMASKKVDFQKSASLLWILGALAAVIAMQSGEGAEELVEHLPGVVESTIELHEEVAKFGLAWMLALGAGGAFALWATRGGAALKKPVTISLLILNIIAAVVIGRVAHLGGQIRHAEIQAGAAAAGEEEHKD
ncbi:MAG: hypothetical protein AAB425_10535 [Bdellovibrionota bacterium]